jgi:hypothetical protein
MQFIITTSDTEYNHVFAVDKYGLKRIQIDYDDDLCPPSLSNPSFPFPWEITEICLWNLLDSYLCTRNYSLAMELLTINKRLMLLFYNRLFKTDSLYHELSTLGFQSRLSSMFHLLYDLWFFLSEYDHPFFEITVPPYKNVDRYYPWNYEGEMAVFQYLQPPAIVSRNKNIDYMQYRTGALSTDIILLAGKFKAGILTASYCRTPVIYLRFIDFNNVVYPLSPHLQSSKEWASFVLLLKKGYGAATAVLIEVRKTVDLPDSTVFTENVLVEI